MSVCDVFPLPWWERVRVRGVLNDYLFLSLAINAGVFVALGYHYYSSASMKDSPHPLSRADRHLYHSLGLSDLQLSKMEPLAQKFHGRLAELGAVMEEK